MRAYSRLKSHQSRKFEINKKTKTVLTVFVYLLNLFILFFLLSKITYIDFFQIKNISIDGARIDISQKIDIQTKQILNDAYFGLFSKANVFIYPKKQLLSSLISSAPQIKSLSVSRNGLRGLMINVEEKKPVAKICASLPDLITDQSSVSLSNCYLADWSGFIFDVASTSSSVENLYYIPSLSEVSTSSQSLLNQYATSTTEFVALQSFYELTEDVGLKPEYILIKENGEYEMYANDMVIYFNNQSPIEKQLENLVSFWKHSINKKQPDIFESIDIRFGTNVFYRKK